MIIKYSEAPIENVITQSKEEEKEIDKKIKEAISEEELVKEAAKEDKPFWVKK